MILIEKENSSFKGVLIKKYERMELDKRRLGEIIELLSTIKLHKNGEKDLLGKVYEYKLAKLPVLKPKEERILHIVNANRKDKKSI